MITSLVDFPASTVAFAAISFKSSTVNLLLGGKDGSFHDQIIAITCASRLKDDARNQDVKTLPKPHSRWQGAWIPQNFTASTITAKILMLVS